MNDRIELTDAERKAAARVIETSTEGSSLPNDGTCERIAEKIIEAINLVREGDLPGTLRRQGSSYAIRRHYGWLMIHPSHVEECQRTLNGDLWEVVYSPGESA